MNGELGTFDRILMNPPLDHGADIRHIEHARGKLRGGGWSRSVLPGQDSGSG